MITSINSREFYSMLVHATSLLESKVDYVNALNVFPVPDGDTGTNMFLTMKSMISEIKDRGSVKPDEIINMIAKGSLLGARGNSGVILAQFFQGVAKVLGGKSSFDTRSFADALAEAKKSSYEAVGNPVEGTMLTVISDIETAVRNKRNELDFINQWNTIVVAARKSVANTPNLLPVLKEAGVVDSGGQGLCILIEGAFQYLIGEPHTDINLIEPDIKCFDQEILPSLHFEDTHDEYGYCTQFLLKGINIDVNSLRDKMLLLANSTVVIGSVEIVRVHIHAIDPGPVLSHAVTIGVLSEVSIVNMDDQNKEFLESKVLKHRLEVGILSIAVGEGFRDLFMLSGATLVLEGGDTMNPSVREIGEAIESIDADTVLVLVNNSNILYAAEQAGSLSSKNVELIASETVVEGVAAILAFNIEENIEVNISKMQKAVKEVLTGSVCLAERDASLYGVQITKGQYIGILNNNIIHSSASIDEALFGVLEKADISKGTLITIYWGLYSSESEACSTAILIENIYDDVETEVVFGGQPYYNYILSVE